MEKDTVQTRDGLRLAVRVLGDGDAALLLHGFTGSSEAWPEPALAALATHRTVIAVDLLGHGDSDGIPKPARFAVKELLRDLGDTLDHFGLTRADVIGYSMGARLALALAVEHGERVGKLVLESGSPGLEQQADREARRGADEALAARIVEGGIEAFVDAWMALDLFKTQMVNLTPTALDRARTLRLRNRPYELAHALNGFGTGVQPSYWHRLPDVESAALLLVGALDEKFTGIAQRMGATLADCLVEVVSDAGHAVHLERPTEWVSRVVAFLEDA